MVGAGSLVTGVKDIMPDIGAGKKMNSQKYISLIAFLLTVLFTYTAVSKLMDFDMFQRQMVNQPLPGLITTNLVWALPLAELLIAGFLMTKRFRMLGLFAACWLMTVFTLYVGLIMLNVFDRVPCSCGGMLETLSWGEHFIVNVVFLGLALAGVVLVSRKLRIRD